MNDKERLSQILKLNDSLAIAVDKFTFSEPVTHIYNPLIYARESVHNYLEKYASSKKKVLFLGMNPGPFGMAQTGVPFGEIDAVQNWLKVSGKILKPQTEHPSRPITGFDCTKAEVSGQRLWGFLKEEFHSADNFFKNAFVWNYCPLLFSEIGIKNKRKVCRNLTPDKIKAAESKALYQLCDQALIDLVTTLEVEHLVGVGAFAESCFKRIFKDQEQFKIYRILHPSPASPLANRDFAGSAKKQLIDQGLWDILKS